MAAATCGSDLHLMDGYVPTMRPGDVIGHEFLGAERVICIDRLPDRLATASSGPARSR